VRSPGYPDGFHVLNGPEDGTFFPVVRVPMYVGSDPGCAVRISLDDSVSARHALVTVVSDGYRVRRLDTEPVYVDGKRAGMLRSRIVRTGGQIQVGQTLLCLECAEDGLARRSRGIVSESDLGWLVRLTLRLAGRAVRGLARFVLRLFGRVLTSWLAVIACIFLILLLSPMMRQWAMYLIRSAYFAVRHLF